MNHDLYRLLRDPIAFGKALWPRISFYREQQEVIRSVATCRKTYVPASNKAGKDFVAGFIVLWFFLTRQPCRIVTTSAKDEHLRVLWGEIGNFINTSAIPLKEEDGGPLVVTHQELRKVVKGERCPISYALGMVASQDRIAALQGHHVPTQADGIPRTLFVSDEASSVPNDYFTMADGWAARQFIFGNTWECENDFKWAVKGKPGTDDKGGDRFSPTGKPWRRIIRIKATDSPNVRVALELLKRNPNIDRDELSRRSFVLPGVLTWDEYEERRATFDAIKQCVMLDADWYEGAEVKLFPPEWLNRAEQIAERLPGGRKAKGVGIDTGQGSAETVWTAVDELGLIDLEALKTPDTSIVPGRTIDFCRRHGIRQDEAWRVCFDLGGGGKEHADRLRAQGWNVRTVAFGESVVPDPKRPLEVIPFKKRFDQKETKYTYFNRRSALYGEASILLDPGYNPKGWGIPKKYGELRRQLLGMPKSYNEEGRLKLYPKTKVNPDSKTITLTDILGCSPDQSDSLVLAIFSWQNEPVRPRAGAM